MDRDNERMVDEFVDRAMNDHGLDGPSADFTDKVMQKLNERPLAALVYGPLISKKRWAAIAVPAVGLTVYLALVTEESSFPWFWTISGQGGLYIPFPEVHYNLSPTVRYAFMTFVPMLLPQVLYLKRFYNKIMEKH